MKRKIEKDHSGPGFVTPPKYLKKVLPWGRKFSGLDQSKLFLGMGTVIEVFQREGK